jgi:hypothetical protein
MVSLGGGPPPAAIRSGWQRATEAGQGSIMIRLFSLIGLSLVAGIGTAPAQERISAASSTRPAQSAVALQSPPEVVNPSTTTRPSGGGYESALSYLRRNVAVFGDENRLCNPMTVAQPHPYASVGLLQAGRGCCATRVGNVMVTAAHCLYPQTNYGGVREDFISVRFPGPDSTSHRLRVIHDGVERLARGDHNITQLTQNDFAVLEFVGAPPTNVRPTQLAGFDAQQLVRMYDNRQIPAQFSAMPQVNPRRDGVFEFCNHMYDGTAQSCRITSAPNARVGRSCCDAVHGASGCPIFVATASDPRSVNIAAIFSFPKEEFDNARQCTADNANLFLVLGDPRQPGTPANIIDGLSRSRGRPAAQGQR